MSVKASISLTESQDDYARALVASGRYPSLSAVLQRGLDLLRDETEARAAETAALRALIGRRREGRFLGVEAGRRETARMLAARKAGLGL